MSAKTYFKFTPNRATGYSWHKIWSTTHSNDLHVVLADHIIKNWCKGCPQHYDQWKRKATGSIAQLPDASHRALRAFMRRAFGREITQTVTMSEKQDIQGLVGECLWHYLASHQYCIDSNTRLNPVPICPTDKGGDAYTFHRDPATTVLKFRLWEIKKYAGNPAASLSDQQQGFRNRKNAAVQQLDENAEDYFAELTAIFDKTPDPDLAELCSNFYEDWGKGAPHLGVGCSISSSAHIIPSACFGTYSSRLKHLTHSDAKVGIAIGVDDYLVFVEKVWEELWKGL